MKETLRLIAVLTLICLIGGVLLAVVNAKTAEPIRQAMRKEQMDALMKVLPACANEPDTDTVTVTADQKPWTFYIARNEAGEFAGCAFVTTTTRGYAGEIGLMVGIDRDDHLRAIEILLQSETPGLGARITEDAFKKQFAGRNLLTTRWAVKKDQGDIDEITAATISSRAVVNAIKAGLDVYQANREKISAARAGQP